MNVTLKTWGLALALAAAATAAACGSPPPADAPPQGTPAPTSAPTAAPTAAPTSLPTPAPTSAAPANPAADRNVALATSKLVEDMKKIGIDFKKAATLEKLSGPEKKKLMPLFTKALGFGSCTGCHAPGDFKKDTRNLKITRQMWEHFVVPLRDEKGGQIFCDSCHDGKSKLLDRSDKKGVAAFMERDYEHKLTRVDAKANECSTCHGEAMETKIIEKLWKIPD